MNRRARHARHRLRRGEARHEPLLVISDDRSPLVDMAALLARAGFRYRSELAPLLVAGALWIGALVLRIAGVGPAWGAIIAAVAVLAVAWPRVTPLWRPIERAYAAALVVASSGWATVATAIGPDVAPLPLVLIAATIVGALPWWAHRRRRAKVQVERTLDAWPEISAAIGMPGSRVMSAVVDRWGWRARVGLPRGRTATELITATPALESGLRTRPGAVRVEPDPDRADHALVRVLTADPHAEPIGYPADRGSAERTVTAPIPLGLFEDAQPVTVLLAHRHGLLGGVAGAGKSGVLNVILAELVACPDVVLWGIDLKGGMELRPWAACLDRLATTPENAAAMLADAVAVLDARARRLAADGARLWAPTASTPALVIVIDEYAELADESATATDHADSIARRGRAVAVTLLAATQRPTQKAMGSGAVRSQMDVRICLRVRERRDIDLILGSGMLTAGWAADTLNAPGKFLISAPEHTTPRRARAYRVDDHDVAAIVARHSDSRPRLDPLSAAAIAPPTVIDGEPLPTELDDPAGALWAVLLAAPKDGRSVRELMTATGMRRTWVYTRLQELAADGRITQISRGRWTAVGTETSR